MENLNQYPLKIVLIGSGNVATSMAHALRGKADIVQIFSPRLNHAQQLATAVGCTQATDDLAQLRNDADVYIISVVDDAIADIINATPDNGALWVHTSGSKPIDVFAGHRRRCGVLYPMQSFSRNLVADFTPVHVFIEANNPTTLADVQALACLLSQHVTEADSDVRCRLHVAAVFACNFANLQWTLANEVLSEARLPFSAMLPLIRNSVDKLTHLPPADSQTGPAARGDMDVLSKHLGLLSGDKRDIYQLLSQSIINRRK